MTPSPDIPEQKLRERCVDLLREAAEEAHRLNHNFIGVEHLFIAASKHDDGAIAMLLHRAGLNARFVRNAIRREVGQGEGTLDNVLPLTPRSGIVLSLAMILAEQDGGEQVEEGHLLLAVLQEGESVPLRKLADLGFDVNHWLQRLLIEQEAAQGHQSSHHFFHDDPPAEEFGHLAPIARAFNPPSSDDANDDLPPRTPTTSNFGPRSTTPLLDKYGRDLTREARDGKLGPAINRASEIRALARTLSRRSKNNPLLLGDAGVGKTAVVEGLAYSIAHENTLPMLRDVRIVQVEVGTLVAGTSLRGQFEERLLGLVNEAIRARNVVLFIDEIHTIVGAGDTIDSNLDAANILKPALARGELKVIGATTHAEYRRAIAQDPALDRRFRTIDVDEPTEAEALDILAGQRARLEEHHGVSIDALALEAAVRLSVRYLPARRLPDKALDLLDEACARLVVRSRVIEIEAPDVVRATDVAAVLAEWTGIPVSQMTTEDRHKLINLEDRLRERVVGQDHAVHAVAAAIKTARAGLRDPQRPVAVFLFVGPSGVGKTELAHALAAALFDSEDALVRLDMSEFHDAHTVARLIGSPPGYKDNQRGGQLTEALRRRPYSVVLLDEVEKAANEVYDLFLQVFDDGRVHDAGSGTVDARHAVFIMTSNIGTQEVSKRLGFGGRVGGEPPDVLPYLARHFRPEFLNRIDEVVTFHWLDEPTLELVLDLQLRGLRQRLGEQALTLTLDEAARRLLLREGHDPANGARPLHRTIERLLTRPLSAHIVDGLFQPLDHILVTVDPAHSHALHFQAAPRS